MLTNDEEAHMKLGYETMKSVSGDNEKMTKLRAMLSNNEATQMFSDFTSYERYIEYKNSIMPSVNVMKRAIKNKTLDVKELTDVGKVADGRVLSDGLKHVISIEKIRDEVYSNIRYPNENRKFIIDETLVKDLSELGIKVKNNKKW